MSAYWSGKIVRTTREIQELRLQDTKIQESVGKVQDNIHKYQEYCTSIWTNKETAMNSALANYNSQIDMQLNSQMTAIQNDTNLTAEQKTAQITQLQTQANNQKQQKKLETETWLKMYKQQFEEAQKAQEEPLNQYNTRLSLKKEQIKEELETKEALLKTYKEYNKQSNQSIFGSGSSNG